MPSILVRFALLTLHLEVSWVYSYITLPIRIFWYFGNNLAINPIFHQNSLLKRYATNT